METQTTETRPAKITIDRATVQGAVPLFTQISGMYLNYVSNQNDRAVIACSELRRLMLDLSEASEQKGMDISEFVNLLNYLDDDQHYLLHPQLQDMMQCRMVLDRNRVLIETLRDYLDQFCDQLSREIQ
ncbi:MAG: hypothetical protein PHD61_05630 [Bacteroidales bacterium]|nr:hypothetical protein [Lentimicrobiaceae bacterium]MDD5694766.1 hypothetical protein [Bacteroidales bacterium]